MGQDTASTSFSIAGDDAEYHSEEALPQLAKILRVHHGFRCTVLFSINPQTAPSIPAPNATYPDSKRSQEQTCWCCSCAGATCPTTR